MVGLGRGEAGALDLVVDDGRHELPAVLAQRPQGRGAIALAGGVIALYVLLRSSVGLFPTLAWAAMSMGFVVYVTVG